LEAKANVKLLLVEDRLGDAQLLAQWLKASVGPQFEVRVATSLAEARDAYGERTFDLTVLDLSLPDSKGLDGLESLLSLNPSTPVVVYTGHGDDHLAREAVRMGAQDYLVKGRLNPQAVSRSFIYAVERKRAEERARYQEAQFRAVFESAPVGILILDVDLRVVRANQNCGVVLGETALAGVDFLGLVEEEYRDITQDFLENVQTSTTFLSLPDDIPLKGRRGSEWTALRGVQIRGNEGRLGQLVLTLEFVTGRRRLESQLRQSQKMEAVGRLAGGIAHDFNNLLTSIIGHTQLAAEELPAESALTSDLNAIQQSAEKAARLTRQLLTFSKLQTVRPEPVDLHETLLLTEPLIHRFLGEEITLRMELAGDELVVLGDRAQVEQILLNICLNAREAMPDGGELSITMDKVRSGDQAPEQARLTIRDQGGGMEEETRQRVFEPFFSTKEGHSGLGLSTVFGIVEGMGGRVEIRSRQGQGSTVTVMLPLHTDKPTVQRKAVDHSQSGASILFVEDEQAIRRLVSRYLSRRGFTVTLASDGFEALNFLNEQGEHLDLVVSDVVMPGMSGPELAKQVKGRFPRLPVLLVSGYSPDEDLRKQVESREVHFLAKPFRPVELESTIRQLLVDSDWVV
jgi:signal transduction histidine kinase